MSTEPIKAWTHEPFELYEDQTWEILDPNMAARIAIFFDKAEAEAYLAWRNRKQAKREAKKAARRAEQDRGTLWHALDNTARQIESWPTRKPS